MAPLVPGRPAILDRAVWSWSPPLQVAGRAWEPGCTRSGSVNSFTERIRRQDSSARASSVSEPEGQTHGGEEPTQLVPRSGRLAKAATAGEQQPIQFTLA